MCVETKHTYGYVATKGKVKQHAQLFGKENLRVPLHVSLRYQQQHRMQTSSRRCRGSCFRSSFITITFEKVRLKMKKKNYSILLSRKSKTFSKVF